MYKFRDAYLLAQFTSEHQNMRSLYTCSVTLHCAITIKVNNTVNSIRHAEQSDGKGFIVLTTLRRGFEKK